jgi:Tol biopolymer transport system component
MRNLSRLSLVLAAVLLAAVMPWRPIRPAHAGPGDPAVAASAWPVAVDADGRLVVLAHRRVTPDAPAFLVYQAADIGRGRLTALGFALDRGRAPEAAVSADGRYVAVAVAAPDDPSVAEMVRYDLRGNAVQTVGAGEAYDPAISADGRYVAFTSPAKLIAEDTNGVADVYLRDTRTGALSRVSVDDAGRQGDEPSSQPSISADGRYVAFASASGHLVPGDTDLAVDVFLRDRVRGSTSRVSVAAGAVEPHGASTEPSISADGHRVAFTSTAPNLVPHDTNHAADIFVRDLRFRLTNRVSLNSRAHQADAASSSPHLSADGHWLAFASAATNLVPRDRNAGRDVFARDLTTGTTYRSSIGPGANGPELDGDSTAPAVSADGRWVAFATPAAVYERDTWRHTLLRLWPVTGA